MPDPSNVVIDLWWDGEDLMIETADGRITTYVGAYVVDIQRESTDTAIETKDITYVHGSFVFEDK